MADSPDDDDDDGQKVISFWGAAMLPMLPNAEVFVCDSPEEAEIAAFEFTEIIAIAPRDGSIPIAQWDWRLLTNRTVEIAPKVGRDFRVRAAEMYAFAKYYAAKVSIFDVYQKIDYEDLDNKNGD